MRDIPVYEACLAARVFDSRVEAVSAPPGLAEFDFRHVAGQLDRVRSRPPWKCFFVEFPGGAIGFLCSTVDGGVISAEHRARHMDLPEPISGGERLLVVPITLARGRLHEWRDACAMLRWDGDGVLTDEIFPLRVGGGRPAGPDSPFIRVIRFALPMLFALKHCTKGVAVEDASLGRSARRRLRAIVPGVDTVRVKWLTIEPFSTQVENESGERSGRMKALPLHLVIGHFATYTGAAPLFGKWVGQFWVPQHPRGYKAFGEIRHRYEVVA